MKKTQTTKDSNGRDSIMVRTDLTVRDLMQEKPSSRWDPGYWHPKYDEAFSKIKSGIKTNTLDDLLKVTWTPNFRHLVEVDIMEK